MSLGVGLDVGAAAVTVAAVRARRGSLALEGYARIERAELVAEGVDVEAPEALARAACARLAALGLPTRDLVLGVSGKDAIIRYSQLPSMPPWRLALLMDYEVKDVAEKTGEALSADWRVLPGSGEGNLVLVALAKDARVMEAVGAWQGAGAEVGGAMPQPVAVGDCYRFLAGGAAEKSTLVVDIGRESTEVAIVELGELIFARSVATGGEAFTERVARAKGLERDAAEKLKRGGGDAVEALTAAARSQLAAMVQASIEFARQQLRRKNLTVERVAVCGGGSRAPGVVEAIGRAVGCPAEAFDPMAGLDVSAADPASRREAERAGPEAAAALGLALSAALPSATRIDVLPLAVKDALERRHRTAPKLVAAGLAAVAAFGALGAALVERSGQRRRQDALAAARTEVARRLAAHEARAHENERREAELRGLGERARAGLHAAALLHTLGAGLPQRLSLTSLALARDDRTGALTLEGEGAADNSQGDATDALRRLIAALEADPRVASTKVNALQNQGPTIPFHLTVVPAGNPAPPADGGS